MRQSKVSELIHSSEDYKNLDFAKVSVIFQSVIDHPDGTFTVVPGSEFVVTRQAKRDNSSSYWIDKKPSDYAKVTAFLRTKGIDLGHNRTRAPAARCCTRRCSMQHAQPLAPRRGSSVSLARSCAPRVLPHR